MYIFFYLFVRLFVFLFYVFLLGPALITLHVDKFNFIIDSR
jgi:hypothetical protein